MKRDNFDFFGSPHPRTLNLNNIQQSKYQIPDPDDHQNLFNTPAIPRSQLSPVLIDPFFSCSHKKQRRKVSVDILMAEQQSHHCEEIQQCSQGINQRLDFSEEQEQDLLFSITPRKAQIIHQEMSEQDSTIKKAALMSLTPITQNRTYERGLKKLAYEAYKFVSNQKKTSYKQVAKRLIKQLYDEQGQQNHARFLTNEKRGQMNIKRRVYDALNVLIALGLLRRSGNKLIGKKGDSDSIIYSQKNFDQEKNSVKLQMSWKKEEILTQELRILKLKYKRRMQSLSQKQKQSKQYYDKLIKIRQLTQRNQQHTITNPQKQQKRLTFPLILFCRYQQRFPMKRQAAQQENIFTIQQENEFVVKSRFRSDIPINIIGDLDLLNNLTIVEQATEYHIEKKEKVEKRKRLR